MNIKAMTEAYLREHGCDGLYRSIDTEDNCGCGLDNLMPCEWPEHLECEAARRGENGLFHPIRLASCRLTMNKEGDR